jgi:hypothetical protein
VLNAIKEEGVDMSELLHYVHISYIVNIPIIPLASENNVNNN